MVTGYEVKMYADIGRIADNLGRIAVAVEKLAAQGEEAEQTRLDAMALLQEDTEGEAEP
jgi:hypothetical protein